jgi:hypothetical protein
MTGMQPKLARRAVLWWVALIGFWISLVLLPAWADPLPAADDENCSANEVPLVCPEDMAPMANDKDCPSEVAEDGSCNWCLTPCRGLQARIFALKAPNGQTANAYVKREGKPSCRAAQECFLNYGDMVIAGKKTTVSIKMADGTVKSVCPEHTRKVCWKSNNPNLIVALYRALFGPDVALARDVALATIGATRSLDPMAEITLPGAIGTAPQTIDGGRPLLLRWNGGAPPFQIEMAVTGGTPVRMIQTSERNQRIDLSSDPLGDNYILTITGKNDVRLSLPLHPVTAAEVPLAPGIEAAQHQEARELVEAVWLLTRAPITWRLEALSRLEVLARDHDNIVAQAIVEPAPSPDEEKDH